MSYITISEFRSLARDNNNQLIAAPLAPSIAEQRIDLGFKAETSEPFKGSFIMIHASVPVALAFGPDPMADPKLHIMSPGDRYYGVNPGHRLSVIMADA